jgi:hypothetical protein
MVRITIVIDITNIDDDQSDNQYRFLSMMISLLDRDRAKSRKSRPHNGRG